MASELEQHLDDSKSPLSHLEDSLDEFVSVLGKVLNIVKGYEQFKEDHSVLLVTNRTSIKAEATLSIEHIKQALAIFQVSLLFVTCPPIANNYIDQTYFSG
jgi:hypothetical protein